MTHANLISQGIDVGYEQNAVRDEAQREACRMAQCYRTQRAELIDSIRGRGFLVNASISGASVYTGISIHDIERNVYSNKTSLWKTLNLWLDLNCQGRTVVLNIVNQWQIDAGGDGTSKRGMMGSKTVSGTHSEDIGDSDLGMYTSPHELYDMRHSSDPIAVAMASEGISVWFELTQDATLFKLTWA